MSRSLQDERLIQAIKGGRLAAVNNLLQNGCDPNCRASDALCTPAIIVAVTSKQLGCLRALLQHGAAVDARDRAGTTAAMLAADFGLPTFLQTLAEHRADLSAVDDNGCTLLMFAAKWDKLECLRYLLDSSLNGTGRSPDVNLRDKDGRTALMYAAMHGSCHCLNLLIAANADVDIVDSVKGFTALMHALEHRESACARSLLDKLPEINIVGVGPGKDTTALTLAFRNSKTGSEDAMIERLLLSGADVSLSRLDQNYLHEMIAGGKKKIVRLMLMNGCPPFDRICREPITFQFSEYRNPISPLCVALLSGFYDIARYLIVNRFLTKYDITTLPNDPGIRRKVQEKEHGGLEALEVLNLIGSAPLSLDVLSFVAATNAIYKASPGIRSKDRIATSGLPRKLQSELSFRTSVAKICVLSWHRLPLEVDLKLEPCANCSDCRGQGFKVNQQGSYTL